LDAALVPYGSHSLGDGVITVVGRTSRYGLANLLQQWVMIAQTDRARLVRDHFESLFKAEDSAPPGPHEILTVLRPRLWSSEQLANLSVPLITRPFAEGLEVVLCVDLPTTVLNLKPDQASSTGRALSELWDMAMAQVDDGLPVHRDALSAGVFALSGDSFFVASRLLALERFAGPIPAHGALVAVPHRHMLLVHPVLTLQAVHALNIMVQAADRLFKEGPGSIVPHVYWWHRDRAPLRVPASVTDRAVSVSPPEQLLAVLNELPPG
jgi:hypothetical protein